MFRKFLVPILAIAGIAFAINTAVQSATPVVAAKPVADPATSPYQDFVAGAGIIEASSENIAIGTLVPGVVTDVYAKVGQKVAAGDSLFKIDDRDLQAELTLKKASIFRVRASSTRVLATAPNRS